MPAFLEPNIGTRGRIFRGLLALTLLIGGVAILSTSVFTGIVLLGAAGFVGFEALRGWCALRACGIKTKF